MQVVLAFTRAIWPQDFFDVICPDNFIPEFWVTTHTVAKLSKALPPTQGVGAFQHVIVGFVAGSKADAISSMSEDEIIRRSLSQLDDIFGKISGCLQNPSKCLCPAFFAKV